MGVKEKYTLTLCIYPIFFQYPITVSISGHRRLKLFSVIKNEQKISLLIIIYGVIEKGKEGNELKGENELLDKVKEVAFVSFCHDIGKFIQRAEWVGQKPDKKHEDYSKDFIKRYVPDELLLDIYSHIVRCADWLSAWERVSEKNEDIEKNKVFEIPLQSVFSGISLDEYVNPSSSPSNTNGGERKYYKLVPFEFSYGGRAKDIEEKFFPCKFEKQKVKDYKNLYQKFIEELNHSGIDPVRNFDTFITLSQKYMSFVPSATYPQGIVVPDLPLFDHLKLVSAIATCFFIDREDENFLKRVQRNLVDKIEEEYKQEGEEKKKKYLRDLYESLNRTIGKQIEPISLSEPIFSFVYLDICGIQDFIYKIAQPGDPQKGIAKQLRGRSFFLNILLDVITRWICEEIGITYANIIFCGGGNAYLFIPKSEKIKEKAKKLLKELNGKLLKKFKGDLFLASVVGDVSLSDWFSYGDFVQKMVMMCAREKQRKFSDFAWNIETGDIGGECKACYLPLPSSSEDLCSICESFIDAGKVLTKNPFVVIVDRGGTLMLGDSPLKTGKNAVKIDFDFINKDVWIISEEVIKNGKKISCSSNFEVIKFHTENLFDAVDKEDIKSGKVKVTFKPLLIQVPVSQDGSIKSFEDIVEEGGVNEFYLNSVREKLPSGDDKIAIVKADVDNLGKILSRGFLSYGKPYPSRIIAFSRMLDFFFGVYVPLLMKEYKNVYMVYAGGDDLFFISRWDVALDAILDIRKKFSEYTAGNPIFTLSAGVVVSKHTVPIRITSGWVESNLKKAKSGKSPNHGGNLKEKNKIYFVDALRWSDFENCINEGKRWSWLIEKGKISRSLIHRFIQVYRTYVIEGGPSKNPMWYPLLYYSIQRNIKEDKEERNLKEEFIEKLTERNLKFLYVISHYCLLKTRDVGR